MYGGTLTAASVACTLSRRHWSMAVLPCTLHCGLSVYMQTKANKALIGHMNNIGKLQDLLASNETHLYLYCPNLCQVFIIIIMPSDIVISTM